MTHARTDGKAHWAASTPGGTYLAEWQCLPVRRLQLTAHRTRLLHEEPMVSDRSASKPSSTFEPSINHWRMRGYKERMTKAQYQGLLLDRDLEFRFGVGCEWKGKHIDAGIYEVWLEERK